MAPFNTTIDIEWIADQAGPYRICFRIVGAPTYTCTEDGTHPICAGGGASCSYAIPITVDQETCDTVSYEGYVQAACEEPDSLVGRIPFNVAFIPAPECKRYAVTCLNSPVESIVVTDPSEGYDPLLPPSVVISGGGGSGATAVAVVGDGEITAIAITVPGTGYTNGVYNAVPLIGGSGTLGTADITIAGGSITVVSVDTPGSGYLVGE